MELFYPAITTVVAMYVWFETEAFEEYMMTFGLGRTMLDMRKYKEEKSKVPSLDYHTYLLMNYSHSFFIKLITCPVCLITWVAPLVHVAYNGLGEVRVFTVFYEILFAWVLFFSLKMLVTKSDS